MTELANEAMSRSFKIGAIDFTAGSLGKIIQFQEKKII